MWSKSYLILWAVVGQGKSQSCQGWWPWVLWYWRYNDFSLSHDLTRQRDQRLMWLYRQVPIKVADHPAKFGRPRHCGSGDMILACQISMRDQRVMWLFRQELIKIGYHPVKLGGHRRCDSGVTVVLVCHVILQDLVLKRSYDFMGRVHQSKLRSCQVLWP